MKVNVYDPFVEKKYIEEQGGNKIEDLDLFLKQQIIYRYTCH